MPTATAEYKGEDLQVYFTAKAVYDWIGDARVPNGTQKITVIEDTEVLTITLLDVPMEFDKLPKELQEKVLELANDLDWDVDIDYGPDYEDDDY